MAGIEIQQDKLAELCRTYHVAKLSLFGSAARGELGPDSDVDMLIEFEPGHVPGFKFIGIENALSALFGGHRVDLVTPKFLNRRIRDSILASAVVCYAKGWPGVRRPHAGHGREDHDADCGQCCP